MVNKEVIFKVGDRVTSMVEVASLKALGGKG